LVGCHATQIGGVITDEETDGNLENDMGRADMEAGLGRILSCGMIKNSTGVVGILGQTLRVLNFFALVYTLEGEAFYRDANGANLLIFPGDMILVFPELAHTYGPRPGKTWAEYYMIFEGDVFDLWRKKGLLDKTKPVYHLGPMDYWLEKFQSITKTNQGPGFPPSVLDICRLQTVLAEVLHSERTDSMLPQELDWASHVCSLLEKDLMREKTMPAVAKTLKMSYESFRKRFTRIVGMSPARFRDSRIINQACRLMQETALSNKEIAYQLGFADECHFSHRFKQITGRSPLQFRKAVPVMIRKK
jgi:AraC-like DNA-binding protein